MNRRKNKKKIDAKFCNNIDEQVLSFWNIFQRYVFIITKE